MLIAQTDTSTRILSRMFIERQKKLNYYWFELSFKEIEFSINAFMDEISKLRRYRQRDEKKIHKFLIQNPNFLLRESYANYYYEKQLYYPNAKDYIEPDFILKPRNYSPEYSLVSSQDEFCINMELALIINEIDIIYANDKRVIWRQVL